MIRADWYKDAMEDACIPISQHELEIIDKISHGGKFNETVYMKRVMFETPIFLTQNQIAILRMLAYVQEQIKEIGRKNGGKISRKKGHH